MIPYGRLVIQSILFAVPQITGQQQPSLLQKKKEIIRTRAQLIGHTYTSNGLTTNTKILENPLRLLPAPNLPRQPTPLPMPEIWHRPVIVRLHHARGRSLRQPELQPELFEMAGIYEEIRHAIIGPRFFFYRTCVYCLLFCFIYFLKK